MNIGNLTRQELIDLGNKLLSASSEEEENRLYNEFNRQFSHPDAANLFYYPENYNARKMTFTDYDPTVEEVIDAALAHQPIQL